MLEGGCLIREALVNFSFQQTVFLFCINASERVWWSVLCVHFNSFLFNLLHICVPYYLGKGPRSNKRASPNKRSPRWP